jgi:hypothetical protein
VSVFVCTSLFLPDDDAVKRESLRPPEFRQPGFEEEFDATTLFYDAWVVDGGHETNLALLGPPLLNLAPTVLRARVGSRRLESSRANLYLRDRCCDIWIPGWRSAAVEIELNSVSYVFTAQTADTTTYRGKRVLFTLSKDNEVAWIVDWIRFHAQNHGADGALLYDNASTRYSAESLEMALRQALPGLTINVVDWPFRYGPSGFTKDTWWDSDFCQAGAFQDARFRFLATASSVLNCDIDELVVSPVGASIFEATEARASGFTTYGGRWIASATEPLRAIQDPDQRARHGDFRFLERTTECPSKWCVVPRACRTEDQWKTHAVKGKDSRSSYSRAFSYRHFRSISTDWKYPRTTPTNLDLGLHEFDRDLDRALIRAGL